MLPQFFPILILPFYTSQTCTTSWFSFCISISINSFFLNSYLLSTYFAPVTGCSGDQDQRISYHRELMFRGGRWKIHGPTQASENKAHNWAGWAHCTSLVPVSVTPSAMFTYLSCLWLALCPIPFGHYSILCPLSCPQHIYCQQIISPHNFLIDQGFQSQTSSVSQLFSLQRPPSVSTFVPLSISLVWDHDISFFLVKTASPTHCLILF